MELNNPTDLKADIRPVRVLMSTNDIESPELF